MRTRLLARLKAARPQAKTPFGRFRLLFVASTVIRPATSTSTRLSTHSREAEKISSSRKQLLHVSTSPAYSASWACTKLPA